jgi:hypothetical protein
LATVDLLLSETQNSAGSQWSTLGLAGEAPAGTRIDEPTLLNVKQALGSCLNDAGVRDTFLFLCCGHGFWKTNAYFVLSDFGADRNNPWVSVIDLTGFRMGLYQEKPRSQWLFWDCCSDIPGSILSTFSNIGDPLIANNAEEFARANRFGPISQCGLASSAPGQKAFGISEKPSRFCEMLVEALGGAGAISKTDGDWWVDDRGLVDATRSYAKRYPDLPDPDFYKFAMPLSNDMPYRLRFRRIAQEPKSRLIAFSKPRPALKSAHVEVLHDSAPNPVWSKKPAGRAKLPIEIPARLWCNVTATFPSGKKHKIPVFGALPIAEPEEYEFNG